MTGAPGPAAHPQVTGEESEADRVAGASASPGRVARLVAALRATRAGRAGVRAAIGVSGLLVVVLGLVLVPLPGPGWLIVFAGLAIWSLEFTWAARLHRYGRRRLSRWTAWLLRQGWPVRVAVTLATVAFVAVVVLLSLWIGVGPGVFDPIRGLF